MRNAATSRLSPRGLGFLVLVASLLVPATPAAAYHRQRQTELERLIAENQAKVEDSKRRERTLATQINESDERRETLEGQVEQADAALGRAQAELAQISTRLSKLDTQVIQQTVELEGMLGELYAQERMMASRAADYYINAPSRMALGVGVTDIGDLIDIRRYAEGVMESDQLAMQRLAEHKDAVADRRAEIQLVQESVAEEHARQETTTQNLAAAQARREAAVRAVEGEISLKERLLGKVKDQRAEYERMIASYEQESSRITSLLRTQGSSGNVTKGRGGWLVWPVSGRITSDYGWRTHPIYNSRSFHTGLDIGAGSGVPIDAARTGKVIDAGYKGAYGLAVVVDHGEGIATLYAHMSSIRVSVGQRVSTGDTVGLVGSTGYSTGPHLHFEVRVNGQHTNPMQWL